MFLSLDLGLWMSGLDRVLHVGCLDLGLEAPDLNLGLAGSFCVKIVAL